MSWTSSYIMHGAAVIDAMMYIGISFGFSMMMSLVIAGWLTIRIQTLAYEVMLPVDRRTYVGQLIAAAAASYAQVCGVVLASSILWWYAVAATPPPLGYVITFVAAALLLQSGSFGFILFLQSVTTARIRHTPTLAAIAVGLILLVLELVLLLIGSALLGFGFSRPSDFLLVWVTMLIAALAALGVVFISIAYRRLLVADFN